MPIDQAKLLAALKALQSAVGYDTVAAHGGCRRQRGGLHRTASGVDVREIHHAAGGAGECGLCPEILIDQNHLR